MEPEYDNSIYDKDSPTSKLLKFPVEHTDEIYDRFTQHAAWNEEIAAEDVSGHYQAWIADDLDAANKPRNRDTLLNDVGPGPLGLPHACHFQSRP